ncbi:bystin [Ricinus communis]|uniref:Bystin, putative n=1 Tax=Ricinus communis TaxID=3988 RepID=B9RQ30_RICCO|nr:bystin [Ricinus communis]EEF46518.1 Bystin, putative [Ricinus communis]|eukprot:XP_002515849.1 bystin [Ricinus communis]
MEKKKRSRHQNPQPFMREVDDSSGSNSKKRSKAPKQHQKQEKMISSGMSSKILKEAMIQQKEIQEEEETNPINDAFVAAEEEAARHQREEVEEEDVDDFGGFDETQTQFGDYDEEINEDEEKLLEAFLSKDAGQQQTLADLIIEKIKKQDANVSSETHPLPKLDESLIDLYRGLGEFLSKYTAGKMPKAFKHIPAMQLWEDVLYLTKPENWSPNAMYQATRIFASNFGAKKAERFYRLVLLPRIRDDIKQHKRLHFALYQALKKSLYKPAAFNKGILFPLCKSGTCNLREAVIVGSIVQKVSIPMLHSSVALLKLAEMEYCGTTSYFIKLLVEKKYALPYRVVDAVVSHYMKFLDDTRIMPVIWHQSLLAFVQRYKNELQKEDKDNLRTLVGKQKHKLVTPEIVRELDNSRNRGEKDDPMSITSPVSVINKVIEEDRFDIPDVPMEED